MGYSPYFQAIPEESELYRRLQVEPKLECVWSHLYPQRDRPFALRERSRELIDAVMGHLADQSDLFRSREEVERILIDLEDLITRALLDAYPDLVDRVAFINKTLHRIEARFSKRNLKHVLLASAIKPGELFSGDARFSARKSSRGYEPFEVVSPSKVRAVAAILDPIGPESVFNPGTEDDMIEDLQSLKTLYREAAELGEAILIR